MRILSSGADYIPSLSMNIFRTCAVKFVSRASRSYIRTSNKTRRHSAMPRVIPDSSTNVARFINLTFAHARLRASEGASEC